MALDPSIFNMLGRGKSSVDYANDFEDRDNKRNMLALQQQAMGMEQQRNALALDQARRQQADDAALRAYMLKQPDLSKPDAVAGLYSAAPTAAGGVLKTYNEGVKASREASAAQTQAQINQQKLADAQWEAQQKKHDKAVLDIANMTDPESALATLTRSAQAGEIPQDKVAGIQQAIAATQGNPQAFRDLKLKLITGLMDAKDRAAAERQATTDASTLANRPFGPDGKPNVPYQQYEISRAQASAPITMGSPVQGIDPKTGLPVFFQPGNRPGVQPSIVQGVTPPPPKSETKPLPGQVVQALTEARDHAATINNLKDSFKDDYAGKGILGFGADASLMAKGVTGADQGSVQWWKDYRKQSELIERNKMFGASLTEGEKAAWASADIGPGMSAATIKANLKTRAALADKVLAFTKQDMIDAGHNEERVSAIADRRAPKAPQQAPFGIGMDAIDAELARRKGK